MKKDDMPVKLKHFIFILAALSGLFTMETLKADGAYISAESLTTQLPASTGISLVKLDLVDAGKNIELAPSKDKVIVKIDGLYYIACAGQVGAITKGAEGYIDLWIMKNGKTVPNTNVRMGISKYTQIGLLYTWGLIALSAGDTIASAFSASGPSLGFIFVQPENESAITSFNLTLFKIE